MAARARPDVPAPEGPPLSAPALGRRHRPAPHPADRVYRGLARPTPRDPGRLAGPPSSSRRCATSTSTPSTSTRPAASAATDASEPHPSSRPTTSRTSTPSRFSEARSTSTSTVPSADSRPPRRNLSSALSDLPENGPSGRTGGRADVVARPPARRGQLDRARCARLAVAALRGNGDEGPGRQGHTPPRRWALVGRRRPVGRSSRITEPTPTNNAGPQHRPVTPLCSPPGSSYRDEKCRLGRTASDR